MLFRSLTNAVNDTNYPGKATVANGVLSIGTNDPLAGLVMEIWTNPPTSGSVLTNVAAATGSGNVVTGIVASGGQVVPQLGTIDRPMPTLSLVLTQNVTCTSGVQTWPTVWKVATNTGVGTATTTGYITITNQGRYILFGHMRWASNATGQRTLNVASPTNGFTTFLLDTRVQASATDDGVYFAGSTVVLTNTQTLNYSVVQFSGGNLVLQANAPNPQNTALHMVRIGPVE